MLTNFNTRNFRFTDVPAYSQIFQSHYCERSQQVFKLYDFAPLTEPTFNLANAGAWGIPSSLGMTGGIEIK